MNQQTLAAIRQWTSQNKGNQSVSGAANDLFYNSLSASLQRDSDASYAKTMMPLSLEYQRGSQGIATEADLRRISAEGGILRDVTAQQGRIQTDLARINSGDVRHVANQQLAGTRYSSDAQVKSTEIGANATRYVADTQLQGTRYSADRQVDATRISADAQRYGYDRQLDGTRLQTDAQRYGYDRQLDGTRDTNRSQEEQRRIQGDQDRRTLTQGTDETLRLRSDARGAIASKGRSFFG
jgi:hypothetical protein